MWNNIGHKLQSLAKVICWVGIICSIIMAIVLWTQSNEYKSTVLSGLLYLILGCAGSWIGSWAIYGLGLVVEFVEDGGSLSSVSSAKNIAQAIRQSEAAEKAKLEKEEKEKQEVERKRIEEEQKKAKWREEMREKKEKGIVLNEEVFLEKIADSDSVSEIQEIWRDCDLAKSNPEADQRIKYYKDFERLYGKIKNIDNIKEELKTILLHLE